MNKERGGSKKHISAPNSLLALHATTQANKRLGDWGLAHEIMQYYFTLYCSILLPYYTYTAKVHALLQSNDG